MRGGGGRQAGSRSTPRGSGYAGGGEARAGWAGWLAGGLAGARARLTLSLSVCLPPPPLGELHARGAASSGARCQGLPEKPRNFTHSKAGPALSATQTPAFKETAEAGGGWAAALLLLPAAPPPPGPELLCKQLKGDVIWGHPPARDD